MKETQLFSEMENLFNAETAEMNLMMLKQLSCEWQWFEPTAEAISVKDFTIDEVLANLELLFENNFIAKKTLPFKGEKINLYLWSENMDFRGFFY